MNASAVVKTKFSAIVFTMFVGMLLSVTATKAQLDPTFGNNGVAIGSADATDRPMASFVLPDGKILVVSNGSVDYFFRFNSDGTPDTTYSATGYKQLPLPYTIQGSTRAAARQPDGKIVLVGLHDSADSFVARLNEDATLDTSFNGTGYHLLKMRQFDSDGLLSVVIQADGKILAAGYADINPDSRLAFARYMPNGTLDPSLGGAGLFIHESIIFGDQSIAHQHLYINSTGKILVGNPTEAGGGKMRRFNVDGSVDGSFTIVPYTVASAFVRRVSTLQPDDKIITAGVTTTTSTLERVHSDALVARYNADGTPDTGFGIGGSVIFDITGQAQSDEPIGVQVMPDGQIVAVVFTAISPHRSRATSGGFLSYAKLSSTGVVNGKFLATRASEELSDPSFTHVLPDGKILTTFRLIGSGWDILLVRSVGIPMQTYVFHGLPYLFASAAAGVDAKPSVYRPSEGNWLVYPFSGVAGFGLADDIPVPSDYISSLAPDFAFFRPSSGTWYISKQGSGVVTNFLQIRWGLAGDIPVPADYDGDGKSDIAVFRPSNGVWYIRNSSDDSYQFVQWGLNGDKPAVGDFDGDKKYDIAVFRPSDGNWYIIRSSDGGFTILHFGLDGDIPVQEDYDGDEKFDIAVYRPSTGVWYRLNSSDGGFFYYQWGLAGDIPVPADYDRDRKMNIAVWRPSNGHWYIVNPDHTSMHFYVHGSPTDIPLPGKF